MKTKFLKLLLLSTLSFILTLCEFVFTILGYGPLGTITLFVNFLIFEAIVLLKDLLSKDIASNNSKKKKILNLLFTGLLLIICEAIPQYISKDISQKVSNYLTK